MDSRKNARSLSLLELGFSLHVLLIICFDYLPEVVRLAVSASLFAIYSFCSFIYSRNGGKKYYRISVFFILVLVMCWVISYAFNANVQTNPDVSLSDGIRELAPLVAMIAFVVGASQIRESVILFWCAIIVLVAAGYALLMPNVFLYPSYRIAPFSAGLHTSAYIVVAALVCFGSIRAGRRIVVFTKFAAIATCLLLIYGYGVRTAQLLLIAYVGIEIWRVAIFPRLGKLISSSIVIVSVLVFLPITVSIVYFTFGFEILSDFTSGRLSNYIERFSLLGGRDIAQFLLGTGPGSDKVVTGVWWWEEKDSHNDLLHFLWIGGLISLGSLLGLLYATWKAGRRQLTAFMVALVLTSASSNALLARPNAAFLYFAAMAMVLSRAKSGAAEQGPSGASYGNMPPKRVIV